MPHDVRRVAGGALLACLLLGAASAPAVAHESDPQVQSELMSVEPALPPQVVLQVQANLAPQFVVANPTSVELDVIDPQGEPFLRISAAGVFANLESQDFYTTNNFSGSAAAVPRTVAQRTSPAPPRWTRLSGGSSWGWFDHRLDPEGPPPADRTRPAVLGMWKVPFRYGGSPVVAAGTSRFEPLRGAIEVSVDPAPDGVAAQVLQGRLPGLFVANTGREPLTVLDEDGQPYVRLSPEGSALNVSSRLHLEDQRARGQQALALPAPGTSFQPLEGSSRAWLDARLRYAGGTPPEAALRAADPTVLSRWRVPVLVGTQRAALTGQVRWVPSAVAERKVRDTPEPPATRTGALVVGVVTSALAVLLTAAWVLRRRSHRRVS